MESWQWQHIGLRQSVDSDGCIRVLVIGELDLATAEVLEDRLQALGEPGVRVVLDVSELSFIDARGLAAVISSVAEAARRGSELYVDRNLSACFAGGSARHGVARPTAAGARWPPAIRPATTGPSARLIELQWAIDLVEPSPPTTTSRHAATRNDTQRVTPRIGYRITKPMPAAITAAVSVDSFDIFTPFGWVEVTQ
jgi:anti-anti-sigma factor